MTAMVSTGVERHDGVDEADVPSAKWGWSKINHRTWYGVGVFAIGFLLLMMHGNHVGRSRTSSGLVRRGDRGHPDPRHLGPPPRLSASPAPTPPKRTHGREVRVTRTISWVSRPLAAAGTALRLVTQIYEMAGTPRRFPKRTFGRISGAVGGELKAAGGRDPRPRVSRTVHDTPWPHPPDELAFDGLGLASQALPGVGFSGIRLTCTSGPNAPCSLRPAQQVRPPATADR